MSRQVVPASLAEPAAPRQPAQPNRSAPAPASDAAPRRTFSRRQLVALAGGGLAALGLAAVAGYEWPHEAAPAPVEEPPVDVLTFVSRPDLLPPTVVVTTTAAAAVAGTTAQRAGGATSDEAAPALVFLSPRHSEPAPSQQGLMIVDRQGHLIYFQPFGTDEAPFDFDVQSWNGAVALTWWQGELIDGHGAGIDRIADDAYRVVDTVRAGHGLAADLHEFVLTTRGTALVSTYEQVSVDLSALGGPPDGAIWDCHVQEIDVATGKVLLDWGARSHVDLSESYSAVPASGATVWDWFHVNSISELPDGNLLVSARNTWALYALDRSSGQVLWRINGKRSDFDMGLGAGFSWQHDSRMVDATTLTVFDDAAQPPEEAQSRALVLDVDQSARRVSLRHAYVHPARLLADNQGSVELLPDGRVFVGWGDQPYFSEFAPDGTMLLDGQLPVAVRSYRAYLRHWVGRPSSRPAIAARPDGAGGTVVYLSWNGSTEVERWAVLAGAEQRSLKIVGTQQWAGFETAVAVRSAGPWFAAAALDRAGKQLARTAVVQSGAAAA